MGVSNFLLWKSLVSQHVDSGDHTTLSGNGHNNNNIHVLKNGGKRIKEGLQIQSFSQ